MLNRFKNVMANAVGGVSSVQEEKLEKIEGKVELAEKFPYSRPNFLQLTEDEVQVSADHTARPILLPRQFDRLPWHAGYAEYVIYKLHEFVFILCSFLLHQFICPGLITFTVSAYPLCKFINIKLQYFALKVNRRGQEKGHQSPQMVMSIISEGCK